ncbi:MAG TPA: hypothetical protein VFW44_03890 [Bryobacteraceae bacterium]|nr:hypothetical protein [Bryobacteraceae bacterium]
MRILAIFLVTLTACRAQSDQCRLEALVQKMERAEQTGDFNTWIGLFTRDKAAEMEKLRPYAKARPEVGYRAVESYARGDEGVLFVKAAGSQGYSYITMKLRNEGGQWKIQDELFRDTAPDPSSVYALIPPALGAFARAGSPWDQVPPGMPANEAARQGWQMKAAFDESYLYIRIEAKEALPAPGSTISTPPGGWPVMKIDTSDAGEFVLFDQVNVGDQATFGPNGRANSHRAYAAYMIRLERKDKEVFSASADLSPSPLVTVTGPDYDIRIPLATMGIMDSRATKITLGDAQWPKSAVLSFAAQKFPR